MESDGVSRAVTHKNQDGQCDAAVAHKVFTVVIVGSIAAGKSELCRRIQETKHAKGVRVVVIPEPVDVWNACGALDNFLEDPTTNASTFQHLAFNTRIQMWKKEWRGKVMPLARRSDVKLVVVVLERSPMCDRLLFGDQMLSDGMMTAEQHDLYLKWFEEALSVAPAHIDLYVDVNTPFEETFNRLKQRAKRDPSRKNEKNYTREYLKRSYDRQREIFDKKLYGEAAPVLHVDGTQPFHQDDTALDEIFRRLQQAGRHASLKRSSESCPPSSPPKLSGPLGDDFYQFVKESLCGCRICAQ